MYDWMLVDVIHGCHDAILELLFGCNADVAQDGACKLGKEAFKTVRGVAAQRRIVLHAPKKTGGVSRAKTETSARKEAW